MTLWSRNAVALAGSVKTVRVGFVGGRADVPQTTLDRVPRAVRRVVATEVRHGIASRLAGFDAPVVVAHALHDRAEAVTVVGAQLLAVGPLATGAGTGAMLQRFVDAFGAGLLGLVKPAAHRVAGIVAHFPL